MKHPRENKNYLGHSSQVEILENFLDSSKIPHAFLFSGPKGIGKSTLAYHFAKALLTKFSDAPPVKVEAEEPPSFDLFGEAELPKVEVKKAGKETLTTQTSRHAERVENKLHTDMLIIDSDEIEKNDIKIDDVRKLYNFISLTPSESNARVVIIDSADYLNNNAANAILKILEEPTKNTFLILVSHKPAFILPTIKSRCREIKFQNLNDADTDAIIRQNITAKNFNDDLEEIDFAKLISSNSPGQAIFYYNNKAYAIYNELQSNLDNLPSFTYQKVKKLSDISSKTKETWVSFEQIFTHAFYENLKADNQNFISSSDKEKILEKYSQITKIFRDVNHLNFDKGDSIKKIFSTLIN